MARFVLSGSILKNILVAAACALAFAWVPAPALAQRVGGHAGGGGHVGGGGRMSAPLRARIWRPPVFTGPRGAGSVGIGPRGFGPRSAGFGPRGFGFRPGPIRVFWRRQFFGAPFYRFGWGLGYGSLWWPTCGPSLGWGFGWGYDCYPLPYYGFGFGGYGFGN